MIAQLINILGVGSLPIEKRHGLAQVIGGSPHVHVGNGQWVPVTADADGAWSYWRLTGNMRVEDADVSLGCPGVTVSILLRLVAMLKRSDCETLPDMLLRAAGEIRATKRAAQTATSAGLVTFPSMALGIDQVLSQEYKKAPTVPADRVLINIDLTVAVTGSGECLNLCR